MRILGNKKKNTDKKSNEKELEKLKEEYTKITLFYLDLKEAFEIIENNFRNKEIIVTDNIHYNYVIDSTISTTDSHNIAELIHYSIEDLKYSSFYLENQDTYSYNLHENIVVDTTNYFIRIMINTYNFNALKDNLEKLRQEHVESFKNVNDY